VKVLIACEFSGIVRRAFEQAGHEAWSCDLLPSELPGPHLQCDVREVLDRGWELLIAHPPCTYLSVSGMHWTRRGLRDPQLTEEAVAFVQTLWHAAIERIAIENPVSILSTRLRKPDQIVQPWWFGHDASKRTCWWLKNLPKLTPTHQLAGDARTRRGNQTPSGQNKLGPSPERWKARSRTYEGMAAAMAQQWGCNPITDTTQCSS
jgi:site-specific DNA-cytosine methylase